MLRNLAVLIEPEDVECNLLACACKVVNGLKEDLVAVLISADVLYHGFDWSRSEVCNASYKSITAGAVSQVVLDIAFRQKGCGLLGIASSEGIDEFECFLNVCHDV